MAEFLSAHLQHCTDLVEPRDGHLCSAGFVLAHLESGYVATAGQVSLRDADLLSQVGDLSTDRVQQPITIGSMNPVPQRRPHSQLRLSAKA